MSAAAIAGAVVGGILGFGLLIFALCACTKCIKCVQEKEVIIVERCGKYNQTLPPGIHCILPFCDAPRVCG